MELNPCETTILMNMEIFPKFWGETKIVETRETSTFIYKPRTNFSAWRRDILKSGGPLCGSTLDKPSSGYCFRMVEKTYRFCKNGNPTTLSILLQIYLIDIHVIINKYYCIYLDLLIWCKRKKWPNIFSNKWWCKSKWCSFDGIGSVKNHQPSKSKPWKSNTIKFNSSKVWIIQIPDWKNDLWWKPVFSKWSLN